MLLIVGCARRSAPPAIATEQSDPCRLPLDPATRWDSLTIALLEPVDLAHVHAPANDSERLVFRNYFDNLVRLDCQDVVSPAVAESWFPDSTGNAWILTLRPAPGFRYEGRTFARYVADILNGPLQDSITANPLGVDSVIPMDDRTLRVALRHPINDSAPRSLADPSVVVMTGFPAGAFRGTRSMDLEPGGDAPTLNFLFLGARDPRDALDRGADLMVTRDPMLVEYVSNRREFVTRALPWSRTYVLAEPETAQPLAAAVRDSSVRQSLANDAVKAEARVAESLDWWSEANACGRSAASVGGASRRLVYPQGDSTARGLAERVVALIPASTGLRAAGLDTAAFAKAVRDGTERAYVLALPRRSLAPCRDVMMWPSGATLTPLIDTRAFAIVRRGVPPLSVDWDGTLRILRP